MDNFIIKHMRHDDYLEVDRVSSSYLKKLLRSPAHALCQQERSSAMEFGTLVHNALEDLDGWQDKVVKAPKFDLRRKADKVAKEEFEREHVGKEVIKPEDYEALSIITSRVRSSRNLTELLDGASFEESGFFTDPVYGIDCKIRVDVANHEDRVLIDWKTCQDALKFPYDAKKYLYHLQAAFYLDGMSEITQKDWDRFVLVAIESKPPYGIIIYDLDLDSIQKGRKLYDDALSKYTECKFNNEFPSYEDRIRLLTIRD